MYKLINFVKNYRFFVITLLLSLTVLWPMAVAPTYTHHDDLHIVRLWQMDKCIKDGQIPCRWVPDLGGGYGLPIFNYYGPLPYYYGEIFYLLTGSFTLAVKIMFATGFIGGFLLMYLLGRKLWGEMGGSLAGLFFSFAPYHAVLLYVRGAMNELWGLMFLPGIIWGVIRLYEKRTIRNFLILGLLITGLVTSHNLSAMIYLPFVALLMAVLFFAQKKPFVKSLKGSYFIYLVLAVGLAILISAFYFLPMTFERDLIHIESTTSGYFHYTEHFKGLRKLIFDHSWGWGVSVREIPGGEKDGMSFQIGWIHLLGWLMALLGLKYVYKDRIKKNIILALSLVGVIGIFMVHPRSEFVWKILDPLKYLQFPWRFLGLIIFAVSLVTGSIFATLKTEKLTVGLWVLLAVLVVGTNFSYFRPEKFIYKNDQELLSGSELRRQVMRSILDYLPVAAHEPPADPAPGKYEILTPAGAEVKDYYSGTNWFELDINAPEHTILRINQYYFPNWKITVNKQEKLIDRKNNLGLMSLILGQGKYHIEGKLHDTPIRLISNVMTLLGLLILLGVSIAQIPRIKKYLSYYLKSLN